MDPSNNTFLLKILSKRKIVRFHNGSIWNLKFTVRFLEACFGGVNPHGTIPRVFSARSQRCIVRTASNLATRRQQVSMPKMEPRLYIVLLQSMSLVYDATLMYKTQWAFDVIMFDAHYMSNGLNLLHPRKDVAEMVIVFCVSLIVPEDLMFAIKSGEHVYQESSFFVSPLSFLRVSWWYQVSMSWCNCSKMSEVLAGAHMHTGLGHVVSMREHVTNQETLEHGDWGPNRTSAGKSSRPFRRKFATLPAGDWWSGKVNSISSSYRPQTQSCNLVRSSS